MMVKICGITNREDALTALEAGASAVGFNFWPRSPRYIDPRRASTIAAELPAGIIKVGVFVDAYDDSVTQAVPLDVVQLHGAAKIPEGKRAWIARAATEPDLSKQIADSRAEAFLIDSPAGPERGGTGKVFNWSLAKGLPGRIILAGGLDAGNVAEAIRTVQPWGVDACSRLESEPGRKDHQKVREFIRAARSATL